MCVCVRVCISLYINIYRESNFKVCSSGSDSLQSLLFLPHAWNISCYTVVTA